METLARLTEELPHLAYLFERYPSGKSIRQAILEGRATSDELRDLVIAYVRLVPPKVAVHDLLELLRSLEGRPIDDAVVEVVVEKLSVLVKAQTRAAVSSGLVELVNSRYSVRVRQASVHALRFALRDEAVDLLADLAQNPQEPSSVRGLALESLTMAGESVELERKILHVLSDGDAEVAFWAAHCLGAIGTDRSTAALRDLRQQLLAHGPRNSAESELVTEIDEAIASLELRHAD